MCEQVKMSLCRVEENVVPDPQVEEFAFPLNFEGKNRADWVLDSGATACATYSEADCVNIRECDISVTAAGCVFKVERMGTVVIHAKDTTGALQILSIKNCLISPRFPYKLLALQAFTNKGHTISMEGSSMSISNPFNKVILIALKEKQTGLYLLQRFEQESKNNFCGTPDISLLAKAYHVGSGKTADENLLWQAHFRFGHKNFHDLSRQLGIKLPAKPLACTSCVMGKSHTHPHISSGSFVLLDEVKDFILTSEDHSPHLLRTVASISSVLLTTTRVEYLAS